MISYIYLLSSPISAASFDGRVYCRLVAIKNDFPICVCVCVVCPLLCVLWCVRVHSENSCNSARAINEVSRKGGGGGGGNDE